MLGIIQAGREANIDNNQWARRALDYQISQMPAKDKYLQKIGIPAPKGQLCREYKEHHVMKDVGEPKYAIIDRLVFDRKAPSPRPVEGQGNASALSPADGQPESSKAVEIVMAKKEKACLGMKPER